MFGNITADVQSPVPSVNMTDGSSHNITDSGDLYFNSGDGWQLAS